MQKSAPSISKILVAVGFTLSCFLLLLFLWVSFGGPVPLKPESFKLLCCDEVARVFSARPCLCDFDPRPPADCRAS